MKHVYVSPPFDITHTLIYKTIDDDLALKINGSKQFPTKVELLRLAKSDDYRIKNAKEIIEFISENIRAYLMISNEVEQFPGLRQSIEQHISKAMRTTGIMQVYRHDKKRKHQ